MKLAIDGVKPGRPLPLKYTKDGESISPPLRWSDLPQGTSELALIFENVTPQTREPFVQWLVYKIPGNWDGLPEGFQHKADPKEPADVLHGRNSFGNNGYDGPLGTVGRTFRFCLRLYALDRPLDVPPGLDKIDFLRAASPHLLDQAELIVPYDRPRIET